MRKIKCLLGFHRPSATGYGKWDGRRYLICRDCGKHYRDRRKLGEK